MALREYLAGGALEAQLAAIELAQGVTITRASIVRSRTGANDNRGPLVAIYGEGGRLIEVRQGLWEIDVTALVVMLAETAAELEHLEASVERYITAIVDAIEADRSLGGRVSSTVVTDFEQGVQQGDRSGARLLGAVGLTVRIFQ